MEKEKKGLSGYYATTFLIGLGFFTMGLMDPLYDNYVPVFLGYYLDSSFLIGLIMTLDNILAILLIPIFSALSDRTETRIGRRMPYIITLLPLSALFFALVPFSALDSLVMLIITVFFLNIFKQAVRGPVVALMPDMVPADLRSEANGVINTMGGLATILGTVLLARLMDVTVAIPGVGDVDKVLAFPVASLFVLIAVALLFIFVKEKKSTVSDKGEKEEKEPMLKSLKGIFAEKENGALVLRRNFKISEGEKILIVEDVITRGGRVQECIDIVKAHGGIPAGVAVLVDRSDGKAKFEVPCRSLLEFSFPTYEADKIPPELAAIPATHPGS